MAGYILWAVLLGGMLVAEGLGLTLRGSQWPTVSDIFRSMTRPLFGRWVFFALWLWAGWHFFIRGWEFFLRGKGAGEPGGLGGGKSLSATLTQVVLPLLVLFLTFCFIGRTSRHAERRGAIEEHGEPGAAVRQRPLLFLRYAIVVAVGGYLLFAIVIALYRVVAGQGAHGILGSAVGYGAFLAFGVALPLFVAGAFVVALIRRSASRSPSRRSGDLTSS